MMELDAGKAGRLGEAAMNVLQRAGAGRRPEPPRLSWLGEDLRQRLCVEAAARVVVLDDDAEFLSMLRCCGLAFAQHGEPRRLLAVAQAGRAGDRPAPWDLALVSLDLPAFAGLVAITRLRDLFPRLRICATLDAVDPDLMVSAMCAGANDYLIKRVVAGTAVA